MSGCIDPTCCLIETQAVVNIKRFMQLSLQTWNRATFVRLHVPDVANGNHSNTYDWLVQQLGQRSIPQIDSIREHWFTPQ